MEFRTEKLLHGGDYNPEQWLDRPDILEQDIQMLKESGCNTVSLGIFSWSMLEPEEGVYHMEWLENIIDHLYENGISTILATPTGARPKWMADKYPEVLRVDAARRRQLFGFRHNHCLTSPVYREKTAQINSKLSKRLGSHPGVILWHLSNEYGGECHCPLCQEAFRTWLKKRYGTIENLNSRWCTTFWSHTYRNFEQIESPSPIGETQLHALNLDWKRFVTEQTADFIRNEIKAIREGGSSLPVTTNLMYYFDGLDYFQIAKELDVVTWDTYPTWHKNEVIDTATDNGMCHDLMRSLKGKPFFQMESCPSSTNWQGISKLKKPGILFAQSIQAIAHGSEGALYFQIRQSRGASEKFHGAVIDHYGENDTRVFREVCRTGEALQQLSELTGSCTKSSIAILYDWNSKWAMEDSQGPRNDGLHYHEAVLKCYRGFRRQGMNVDLVDMERLMSIPEEAQNQKAGIQEEAQKPEEAIPENVQNPEAALPGNASEPECMLDQYRILAIPMGYMFKEGFDEKVRSFVEKGGILLMTYWSGIADDTDRCYLGGTPHGLMDVLGLRSAEIDGLYDWEENTFEPVDGNPLGLTETYRCKYLCELAQLRGAQPLMTYGSDFYAGYPALTVHDYGKGKAWYIAADAEEKFYEDFLKALLRESKISCVVQGEIPQGLEITTRENEVSCYYIYQNFGKKPAELPLPEGILEDLYGDRMQKLDVYDVAVVKQKKTK